MSWLRTAVLVAVSAGCGKAHDRSAAQVGSAGAVQPAPAPPVESVAEIVARTWCDYEWRMTSASAHSYPSIAECVKAETRDRPCNAAQARGCREFSRTLQPAGDKALLDSPACVACLDPTKDPALRAQVQQQLDALAHAKLVVHSARLDAGPWPADLRAAKQPSSRLVEIDVELSDYGVRIDPDDFVLATQDGTKLENIGGAPYTERLTRDGKPIDWRDPSVVDDPDLRMLAYFVIPASAAAKTLVIDYENKLSTPFTLR